MLSHARPITALILAGILCSAPVHSEPEHTTSTNSAAKQALAKLGTLIGEWRGTGQVRRGSTKGAWRETGEFVWDFSQSAPAITYVVDAGKHLSAARITFDPIKEQLLMTIQKDDATEQLAGKWDKNKLVFTADSQRITITPLNEKRTLVLYEQSIGNNGRYSRVGEVGYTRAGTRLAIPGGGQRECIVTGGTGTMPVTYQGETYYVCCSGCKQAFEDDPAGIIAEFKAKLADRKAP